jgi:outer membrane protein assembly factor BamB
LILESGAVVIAGNGETMAFAADTGQALWHEQFSSEGRGLVSIASATDHSQADDR